MDLTEDDLREFRAQGEAFLKSIELEIDALARGEPLKSRYDAIYRALHGLRGSASMLGMDELKAHLIQFDEELRRRKGGANLDAAAVELFRGRIRGARALLDGPVRARFNAEPAILKPAGRILVIDDEPDLVELLSHILIASNMEVEGTSHPDRVADLIESFKPDAVLTDIAMPRTTGMDILRQVNQTQPDLPVIFVSGQVDKDSLLNAIDLGVFAVIEKPFDVVRVVEVSRNAVRKFKMIQLINHSIGLIAHNLAALDHELPPGAREDARRAIDHELKVLLDGRRQLRSRTATEG